MRLPVGRGNSSQDAYAFAISLRAAIVVPAVFAFSLEVAGNREMAPFAFFSSLALLVFVDFGGPPRSRRLAYLGLAGGGAVLVVLGTLCSSSPALAAGGMALVGFSILFAGIVNGYLAAASTALILAFVLSAMEPVRDGALSDRLLGWLLGSGTALLALALPWPHPRPDLLRRRIAAAIRALADGVAASARPGGAADGDAPQRDDGAVRAAVQRMHKAYLGTPQRPTGATGPAAATGQLVEDVAWAAAIPPPAVRGAPGTRFPDEDDAVRDAVAQVLRGSADRLSNGREHPDLAALLQARSASATAFGDRVDAWRAGAPEPLGEELEETFRARILAFTTWELGGDALRAAGEPAPDPDAADAGPGEPGGLRAAAAPAARDLRTALSDVGALLAAHTTIRSVWLRNSVRGALGLTLAVLVGQLADVQHSYWIVLGTLAVLRSQALNTGMTFLYELAGTAIGIAAGALLVLALGTDTALLWVVLPPATLLATYARRAISFAAGQACFSFLVLVVFNLIVPAGWRVGLVRVEDVAIGATISLLAAVLLWPRGAASVLRGDLAAGCASSAALLRAVVHGLLDGRPVDATAEASRTARAAALRLDSTLRQYLNERARQLTFDDLAVLVSGTSRLRRTAEELRGGHQLLRLRPVASPSPALREARAGLLGEVDALCGWYEGVGDAIAARAVPPPRVAAPTAAALDALDDVPRDAPELPARLAVAWTQEHLVHLRALDARLEAAAGTLAREGR